MGADLAPFGKIKKIVDYQAIAVALYAPYLYSIESSRAFSVSTSLAPTLCQSVSMQCQMPNLCGRFLGLL